MKYCRIRPECFEIEKILSKDEIDILNIKKFFKDDILYYDDTIKLLIFKSGKAKAVFYDNGESFTLHYLLKNSVYMLDKNSTIEFLDDSEVYFLDSKNFSKLFTNILFTNMVLESMAKNIEIEREIIYTLVFNSCLERVVTFFIDMAHSIGEERNNGILIDLSMSISEFSNLVASKRQTVSTILNELANNGIIKKYKNQKYLILDIHKLEALLH